MIDPRCSVPAQAAPANVQSWPSAVERLETDASAADRVIEPLEALLEV